MPSEHLLPLLDVVQEILAKGDEAIDLLMLAAKTPEQLASARLAENTIHAHAAVIRKLLESQLQLHDGIERIVEKVNQME